MNIDWSADLVADVQRRWNEGQSARQIGIAHYMTRNSVIGKVSRLRIADPENWRRGGNAQVAWTPAGHVPAPVGAPPSWTPEDVAALREHILDGVTHRRIAEILGRTKSAVDSKVKSLGWVNGGINEPRSEPSEQAPLPAKSVLPPLRVVRPLAETSIGHRINRTAGLQEARGEPFHWRAIQPLVNANTPPVNLFDRTGCAWPVGHDGHLTMFCNVATDGTYCEHHRTLMIQPRAA